MRAAFSLVELLVAIAILAVLLGLLLPAVQKVRAAAARASCLNHLKQIGLALHSHHADHQRFPPGGIEWRPPGNFSQRQLAWCAFILPYLQQQALFDQIDFTLPFDHPANALPAAVPLPVFRCPASRQRAALVEGRGACDYGGIFGERILSPNQPPKGMMIYDRAFAAAEITDGLACTVAVSEDSGWIDGQWINGRNLFDQAFAINRAPPFENDIRSDHPRGANGLFADGSARFLNENLSLPVLAALCTRTGGETACELD